ncbi:tyrosine-type recombinase/integrase [Mycolicibacterium llatzerense]|uniref:tyrosine-type recombinase/integrase n=1 Tax=Mycolicibacterium llatzerense TaxID=280871 RepID=UPI0021B59A83|nr:tyrosine-type recombinase/integrase [Mycolicibacterium llatzerense]
MHVYFANWVLAHDIDSDLLPSDSPRLIQDGTPIILDDFMRPMEPWCTFLRLYCANLSANSVKAYARDTLAFARFLDARQTGVTEVAESDLVAYRAQQLAAGLSWRSWARHLVVIRALFTYLYETGQRDTVPWIQVGSRSVVSPRIPKTELDVRALSHAQWITVRDIGFGGQLPNGEMDCSYRGRSTVRNVCAVELALTTGMRLSEWSTLLDCEIAHDLHGVSIALQACAKNERSRRVYIPASTIASINLYRNTERVALVRKSQASLRSKLASLAVVTEIDHSAGKLLYRMGSENKRTPIAAIPIELRRRLVRIDDSGLIEPLSLFVGKGGKPPTQRRWHQYFTEANERLARLGELAPVMGRAVTPHDLRHTFAIVMLRSLQQRAANLERSCPTNGFGTISEHIIHNPLLTLQRLLGHASPSTTMVYLRYVDESDDLIQRAFESWGDETKTYADYALEALETRTP